MASPTPILKFFGSDASHASSVPAGRIWVMTVVIAVILGVVAGVLSKWGTAISSPNGQVVSGVDLTATCVVQNNVPKVRLSWNALSGATEQTLVKKAADGALADIVTDSSSPLILQEYFDEDVRFGERYSYFMSVGKLGVSPEASITLMPQSCSKIQ